MIFLISVGLVKIIIFYQKNNTQDAAKEKIFIFGVTMDNEYSTFLHTFVRLIQSDRCRKKKKVA